MIGWLKVIGMKFSWIFGSCFGIWIDIKCKIIGFWLFLLDLLVGLKDFKKFVLLRILSYKLCYGR